MPYIHKEQIKRIFNSLIITHTKTRRQFYKEDKLKTMIRFDFFLVLSAIMLCQCSLSLSISVFRAEKKNVTKNFKTFVSSSFYCSTYLLCVFRIIWYVSMIIGIFVQFWFTSFCCLGTAEKIEQSCDLLFNFFITKKKVGDNNDDDDDDDDISHGLFMFFWYLFFFYIFAKDHQTHPSNAFFLE